MLKDMKSYGHLKPGQKGTRKLVEKYGASLLCVRYRYDEIRGVRLKTVEIIVEEKAGKLPLRYRDEDTVSVIVAYTEKALRDRLEQIKGSTLDMRHNRGKLSKNLTGGMRWQDRCV